MDSVVEFGIFANTSIEVESSRMDLLSCRLITGASIILMFIITGSGFA